MEIDGSTPVVDVLQLAGADMFNTFSPVTDRLRRHADPVDPDDWGFGVAINLAGVGSDGSFRYGSDITVDEVARSIDQGLFDGDPFTWAIYCDMGAAGGWSPDGLYEISTWLFDQGAAAAVGYAVGKGLDKVTTIRYRSIRDAWRSKGFTAPRLKRLLRRQSQWDETHLASLLSLEVTEARCVLRQAGYLQSTEDELWRIGEDHDAVTRRMHMEAIVEAAENDTP